MNVNIKILDPRAKVPEYKSEGAAGFDLHCILEHDLFLQAGASATLETGVAFEIPVGYEGQVRPRSGLAFNQSVVAAIGTIDSDFRHSVKVRLMNHSFQTVRFTNGDRVAQMVICPVVQVKFIVVDQLSSTARGASGFGSTGIK